MFRSFLGLTGAALVLAACGGATTTSPSQTDDTKTTVPAQSPSDDAACTMTCDCGPGVVVRCSEGCGHGACDPYQRPQTGPDASACPADPEAAIGSPCSSEGMSCGSTCGGGGFCNQVVCQNGAWTNLEAPPVAPGDDGGSAPGANPDGCPATWQDARPLCAVAACSTVGLTCWYPGEGDWEGDAAASALLECTPSKDDAGGPGQWRCAL